jgi:hypothetical protein
MTGKSKPVVEKKILAKAPPPPRAVKQAVFYEVETISDGKRSVDKFE